MAEDAAVPIEGIKPVDYDIQANVRRQAVETMGYNLAAGIVGDTPGPDSSVLMIGGIPRGGENNPNVPLFNPIFGPLSQKLATENVRSFVMHPAGVGGSSGDTYTDSLYRRTTAWFDAVLMWIAAGELDPERLSIVGNSMGGHIAVRLIQRLKERYGLHVQRLALISPAAYIHAAELATFGAAFRAVVDSKSALSSRVFSDFADYLQRGGRAALFEAELEQVIVPAVQQEYRDILDDNRDLAGSDPIFIYPEVEHGFRIPGTPEVNTVILEDVVTAITRFLTS